MHPSEIVQHYFSTLRYASERRDKDIASAIAIQSCFRQYLVRRDCHIATMAAINIQRVFRGYIHGKIVIRRLRVEKQKREIELYFDACATAIQRIFRGWYFRKYKHDFRLRQQYLRSVEKQNESVKEMLRQYEQQQKDTLEEERRQGLEFQQVATNLHHLVSTKTIPGVYKYAQTVYQTDLENELRTVASTNYLERTVQKERIRSQRQFSAGRRSAGNRSMISSRLQDGTAYAETRRRAPPHLHYMPGEREKSISQTRLPPIDPRDSMRTNHSKRLGPFLPQEKLLEVKQREQAVSVARSRTYGEDEGMEQFQRKIDRMTWLAGDFVPNRKPEPLRWNETLRSRGKYLDPPVGSF